MTATLATSDPILLAFADEVGDTGPIAVVGGKTRWDVGGPSSEGARLVQAPSGIVSYSPEEMTITVRAGTSVSELNETLAEKGQRSAVPDRGGTVGGALAVGENDLRALNRGLIRTAPLQLRYISAEGRLISSGGPTVKNVTGFDLPRLMVGSLGTLGLLAEVVLRTNPIPAVSRWLSANNVDPQATFDAIVAPSAVLWDGSSTWVQLEGHGVDVDADQRTLGAIGHFTVCEGPPPLPPNRWSLTPSEVLGLGASDQQRDPANDTGAFVAAVGLGLAFADNPQPPRAVSAEVATVSDRIKANFDPTGRLNPGRNPARR